MTSAVLLHPKIKMQEMKTKNVFAAIGICALMSGNQMLAQPEPDAVSGATLPVQDTLPSGRNSSGKKSFAERFTIGGYGEAVMTYNMYSDNFGIYSAPKKYNDSKPRTFRPSACCHHARL